MADVGRDENLYRFSLFFLSTNDQEEQQFMIGGPAASFTQIENLYHFYESLIGGHCHVTLGKTLIVTMYYELSEDFFLIIQHNRFCHTYRTSFNIKSSYNPIFMQEYL